MNKTLYVITPVFNPQQFKSRGRLYRNFAQHVEVSGAQLLTIEAAFGAHPWEVTSPANPWNIQVRTDTVLWHKERMINLAIERLKQIVPDAEFVCWSDADITLSNHNWVSDTVHALMHAKVVQPFATAVNLDKREDYMWACPSSFRAFLEGRGFHQDPPLPVSQTYKGHPGLIWAARLSTLDELGGLYDTCIAGSGDTVMSNCLKGDWSVYLPDHPSPYMAESMKAWQAKCDSVVRGNIGFVPGLALHHWHGKSGDRGYEKRWSITSFHRFDAVTDLKTGKFGMYEWAGNKPRLEDDIRLSLSSRDEDA